MASRVIHLNRLPSMATEQPNYVNHNEAVIFTNEELNFFRKSVVPGFDPNLNKIVFDNLTGKAMVSVTQFTQNFFTILWTVNIRGSISEFAPSFAVVVERMDAENYRKVYETCCTRMEKTIFGNVIIELPEPDNSTDIYTYNIALCNSCEGTCYYDSRVEQSASMLMISLTKE